MEFIARGIGQAIFGKAKSLMPKKQLRLCVLGLDNAGKTTILRALSHEEIQHVMPT